MAKHEAVKSVAAAKGRIEAADRVAEATAAYGAKETTPAPAKDAAAKPRVETKSEDAKVKLATRVLLSPSAKMTAVARDQVTGTHPIGWETPADRHVEQVGAELRA